MLRGHDAMRTVAEIARVAPEELPGYLEEWEREAKPSPDWLRVPSRSLDLEPAHTLEELRRVERRLTGIAAVVQGLVSVVASSRETGRPAGYVRPISTT